jgi:hypothetical protein
MRNICNVFIIWERKKERKKEKKRKYSGCTILSRKNYLLRIVFIFSGITQTKTNSFSTFG